MEGTIRFQFQRINWMFVIGWGLYFLIVEWLLFLIFGVEKIDEFIIVLIRFVFPVALVILTFARIGHLTKERRLFWNKWASYP